MKRNCFYNGKTLSTECLKIEQEYHRINQLQLNSIMLGKSVLDGLEVKIVNDETLSVSPGIASDGQGHILRINRETSFPVFTVDNFIFQHELTLFLCYNESVDGDFIEENCYFSFKEELCSVPISDIVVEGCCLKSLKNRKLNLNSTFLKFIVQNNPEKIKKENPQKISSMQGVISVNTDKGTVFRSEKIYFKEDYKALVLVNFSILHNETELIYGDDSLFVKSSEPYIVRKAVRVSQKDGYFRFAFELDRPHPANVYKLQWNTIGVN